MGVVLDLGNGVTGEWIGWRSDRDLNPQHAGLPDVERHGLVLTHTKPDGTPHDGFVTIDSDVARQLFPNHPRWQMQSQEPLTLTPSVLCSCGWHGFITDGRWRPC